MKYGDTYTYPAWAQAVGLCMAFASMLCVPAYAIYAMLTAKGSLKEVVSLPSLITLAHNKILPFPQNLLEKPKIKPLNC